jgi:RHH-type proline utilization regulon transcriptional repressor/proline dehydrogenase/delta 1-pyrroline-5-carboxylate dehydrogenase
VGVQPFGGRGLSGTGPKAGGPLYLQRLLRPASTPHAWRAVDGRERGLQLADVFACRPLVTALREAGEEWAATPMHERIRAARALVSRTMAAHAQGLARSKGLEGLIAQAEVLGKAHEMPGPTGESNTLSFDPRGLMACLCRDGADTELLLHCAVAALLAGNTLLFLTDAAMRAPVMRLREALSVAGFPDALSAQQLFGDAAGMALALGELDIDGAICCADPALATLASRALAAREGAILPLLDEEPGAYFLARFVHEKTVSVNTTAAGGNAALMSQTEGD